MINLYKIIREYDSKLFIILFFDIVVTALQPFPLIIFSKHILDSLVNKESFNTLLALVVSMIGIQLVLSTLSILINSRMTLSSTKLGILLSSKINEKCLDIDYNMYDDPYIHDKVNYSYNVVDDNNFVSLLGDVRTFICSVIIIIGIITIVVRTNVILMLISLIVVAIQSIINSRNARNQIQFVEESRPYIRRSEYLSKVSNEIMYRKDILIYGAKSFIKNKMSINGSVIFSFNNRMIRMRKKGNLFINFANNSYQFLIYVLLGYKVLVSEELTIGDFSMYMAALTQFGSACSSIANSVIHIRQRSSYIYTFIDFMNLKSVFKQGDKKLIDIGFDPKCYSFTFDNVSFRYTGQLIYALKNINLVINSNDKLAVVGENGAGKSTFVKLLIRLYDPTEGKILLNNIDIKEIEYSDYLKIFSVVFQDFQLMSFSIRENISFSEVNEDSEIEKINELIKSNGLYNKIRTHSDGIEAEYSRRFDTWGLELSGGEMQKIAIIRSLYKNATFLILDEPTSSLDPPSENEIYLKYSDMTKGKAALYISHRLASTKFCDYILVFEKGKIMEKGTFNELIQAKKRYYEMYMLQAQYYSNIDKKENENNCEY